MTNSSRLKSGPALVHFIPLVQCPFRGMDIHQNIPISVTKLSLGLRVCLFIFHLTVDKLFPVNRNQALFARIVFGGPFQFFRCAMLNSKIFKSDCIRSLVHIVNIAWVLFVNKECTLVCSVHLTLFSVFPQVEINFLTMAVLETRLPNRSEKKLLYLTR